MDQEHVVLVDENNTVLGTAAKATVHGADTPLHRAFSFFGFDKKGRLLIQQRAGSKKTWPLIWSNTCCGHPALGENTEEAVRRRVKYELGMELGELYEILPDYRYKAMHHGVMENELCPVWVALLEGPIKPNPTEVEAVDWVDWRRFIDSLKDDQNNDYDHFSVWSKEEALLLDEDPDFIALFSSFVR